MTYKDLEARPVNVVLCYLGLLIVLNKKSASFFFIRFAHNAGDLTKSHKMNRWYYDFENLKNGMVVQVLLFGTSLIVITVVSNQSKLALLVSAEATISLYRSLLLVLVLLS